MVLKLHMLKGCPFCTRVMLAINAAEVEVEYIIHVEVESLKTPEYLALNPNGTAPTLITPEGPIGESIPIMNYIARMNPAAGLLGSNSYEQSQVETWTSYAGASTSIAPAFIRTINKKNMGPDEEAYQASIDNFVQKMQKFNEHLSTRTFLVGHQVTIADLAFIPFMSIAMSLIFDKKGRSQFKHVSRYFEHIVNLPIWTRSFGRFRFCEKTFPRLTKAQWEASNLAQKEAEEAQKKAKKSKGKKKKQPQQKKEAKPQQPKKAKKPAKPETAFDFYGYKTLITNADNKQEAVQFLVDNFDPKAFSVWYGRYDKLPTEGKTLVRTANLNNVLVKNITPFIKHIYGVWGIYGDEPDLEARGVFLWHDPDFLPEMKAHPNSEYIQWRKLDLSNAADLDVVNQYWGNLEVEEQKVEDLTIRRVYKIK